MSRDWPSPSTTTPDGGHRRVAENEPGADEKQREPRPGALPPPRAATGGVSPSSRHHPDDQKDREGGQPTRPDSRARAAGPGTCRDAAGTADPTAVPGGHTGHGWASRVQADQTAPG